MGLDLDDAESTLVLVQPNGKEGKAFQDLKLPYRFASIPTGAKIKLVSGELRQLGSVAGS